MFKIHAGGYFVWLITQAWILSIIPIFLDSNYAIAFLDFHLSMDLVSKTKNRYRRRNQC